MSRLYNEIENAASISVSAPLYFSSIPGTLKNFIDRCQTLWEIRERGRIFVPKKGFVIISAGSLSGKMPDHALAVVKHFFNTINCSLNSADVIFIDNTDVRADIISEKLHLIIAAAERFRSCFLPPE